MRKVRFYLKCYFFVLFSCSSLPTAVYRHYCTEFKFILLPCPFVSYIIIPSKHRSEIEGNSPWLYAVVRFLSPIQLFQTSWAPVHQASLSFTISHVCSDLHPQNEHLILCSLLLLPSIFPSIRAFSNKLTLHMRLQSIGASASAWVLSMKIQGWFCLGLTGLISLLSKGLSRVFSKCHSWKASILQHSAFFMVQLSHPYMTTGETIAMTIWIFVGKVIFLLFNMLSRFVIAFLPRSKHLLVSWLQSSAVILEAKKIKSVTALSFSPSVCLELMGLDVVFLVLWMLNGCV